MLTKDERHYLHGRIDDLIKTGRKRRQHAHTEFLDMSEASEVLNHLDDLRANYILAGGYPDAERKVAIIRIDDSMVEFPGMMPFVYIRILPASNRYLRIPTHRDYLGALMNLGIERRVLGDLVIQEFGCILICMSHISDYILSRLTSVGNCPVSLEELPELTEAHLSRRYEVIRATVASLRLDSVVKAAVSVSRGDSLSLIKGGRVFVNGRECLKGTREVIEGQVISVRGHGKFRIRSIGGRTKKDRITIEIDKYI